MDNHASLNSRQLAEFVTSVFRDHMSFNHLLGLKISQFDGEGVEVRLPWHEKLTGNPIQKILHGGVTAAVLDTVGGLMAILHVVKDMPDCSLEQFQKRLAKIGTIDMRVDYLRPGKGREFIATASVIRKGSRVAVCRMELHNEQGEHIAFGTGTYMVG
ncbi:thioesterase family protein [Bowmanella dokdonensis]|uniref:Medium/long-chain acyl-CoA thioesterase YigI n=1 Tax=Bowmanella dokdonensis TaxID=751969 RepID=A0A939IR42_9ALTE|nr:thioesterase family protein [Bowmanella dokdonensis]MBN7825719.1 thioesterase family protein [Bowmanella dokdonensis]